MTRTTIQDAAIAAAKAWSHAAVEVRHVLYAVCRLYQRRPEVQALLPLARAALDPRGMAVSMPVVSPDAASLLDTCTSEEAAVAAALERLPRDGGARPAEGPEGTQVAPAADARAGAPAPTPAPREDTAAVLAELDALIGLSSVKNQVRELIAVVQANEERRKAGLPAINTSLHLVFTGSPGTGKTTVARLVARLYAAAGALQGAKFLEATRADLVAGYVGQTAIKTMEVIERARPGVLFIDEAYSLAARHGSDFAHECVATLVKYMEDHRADLALIAAGYDAEMREFIASNPGLRSRFKTFIKFPDYSPAEMVQIFSGLAREASIALAPGVLQLAEKLFREGAKQPSFGNARFVRSLWEQAYGRMAVRAAQDGKVELRELSELVPDDLPTDLSGPGDDRRIGFR